ncbi:phosphoprotein [Sawgrass virus]|uniref:Phosphoprotein n=1 Tax=Sawgrass virus TaxID=1620896 RepID=A0A0D3R1I3_9RHAB|nr:phosphoprotein [Sawgrass virus]AJR28513.1 phosphoprotein [Sawgrass virus]
MSRPGLNADLVNRIAGGLRATLTAGTDEDPSLGVALANVEGPESKTWDTRPLPGETDSSDDEEMVSAQPVPVTKVLNPDDETPLSHYHDQMDELVGKMGGFDLTGYLNSGNGAHKCAEYLFKGTPSPAVSREIRRLIAFLKDQGFIKHAVYSSRGVTIYGSVKTSPSISPESSSPCGSEAGDEAVAREVIRQAPDLPRAKPHNPRLVFGYKLWYKTPSKGTIKVDPAIICQDNGCSVVTPPDDWLDHHRERHQRPALNVTRLIYVETDK